MALGPAPHERFPLPCRRLPREDRVPPRTHPSGHRRKPQRERLPRPTPHVLVVLGGLALAGGPGPFDPVVLALLPLGHLVLRLAWWAAHVAPTGRLELRALIPDARRFVVLQAVLQVIGVALLLVAGTTGPPVLLALGGVALLALTVLLTARRE